MIKEEHNLSSLFNNGTEYNDYCVPLSLNKKDLTLYDRQLLVKKIIKPCDDNCEYIDFNFDINYSTCICPITLPDNKKHLQNTINKKIKDIEEVESFYELLEKGNYKYLECYKNFSSIKCPISFAFCSAFIISSIFLSIIIYRIKENNNNINIGQKKKEDKEDNVTVYKKNNENNIVNIASISDDIGTKSDDGTSININQNRKDDDNMKFCKIWFHNLREKFLYSIFKEKIYLIIAFIIILIHSYLFFNMLLFSDKYISIRYSKGNINGGYIIIDTLERIKNIIIISFLILRILKWILDLVNNRKKAIIIVCVILLQLGYFYFIHIFLNINPNSEKIILLSTIITLALYIIFYIIVISIISLMEWISIKKNIECLSKIIHKIDELL